jgi:hypothetical protein
MQMEAISVNTVSVAYKHKQKGGFFLYSNIFFTLLSIAAFCWVLTKIKVPGALLGVIMLGMVIIFLILSTFAMSSLTVSIDNEFVRIVFGLHLFAKKFAIKDITGCMPVKNDFWDNWGIRMWSNGWLYNVAGFDAVEIILKSGKHNRIGTNQPQELAQAIQNAVDRLSKKGI